MAIWTAAEEYKVENGDSDAILCRERFHQLVLILVCDFIRVVEEVCVYRVHGGLSELGWDFVEELVLEQAVVAILVVQRHEPFVGHEDVPRRETRGIVLAAIARRPFARIAGREPPEMATRKVPCLSSARRCDFSTYFRSDLAMASVSGKLYKVGDGPAMMI
jgi:hypothetical protein